MSVVESSWEVEGALNSHLAGVNFDNETYLESKVQNVHNFVAKLSFEAKMQRKVNLMIELLGKLEAFFDVLKLTLHSEVGAG